MVVIFESKVSACVAILLDRKLSKLINDFLFYEVYY